MAESKGSVFGIGSNDEYDEDEEVAVEKLDNWYLFAHVYDKVVSISCGDASQRVRWLAHVAIARWDDANYQGWKRLGIPTIARLHSKDGEELDLNSILKDVVKSGDHIFVETSMPPSMTR